MKFTLLAVAAAAASVAAANPTQLSSKCHTNEDGRQVHCEKKQLSDLSELMFNVEARHINLRHNNIKEIVSAAWRSNRARRAWTSPCDGTVYADTDNNLDGTIDDADWHQSNGYHSAADGESGDVAIYGDHNSPYADSVNTTFISAFPQSSLACLLKIYSLALDYNHITALPNLGSGANGVGFTQLGLFFAGHNFISEIGSDLFKGLGATLMQISLANNKITALPNNLFDETFKKLSFFDLRSNMINKIGINVVLGLPAGLSSPGGHFHINADGEHAGNVLACPSGQKWWATVTASCGCASDHPQFVAGSSEFNDLEDSQEYRVCRVGQTPVQQLGELKTLVQALDADFDTILSYQTTLDAMHNDTAAMQTDLANIHTKLDLAGCPAIDRRFNRD